MECLLDERDKHRVCAGDNHSASAVEAGHAYRVRARLRDNTGRWSHWSAPINLWPKPPFNLPSFKQTCASPKLCIIRPGDAYEYVELANIGATCWTFPFKLRLGNHLCVLQ